MVVLVSLTDIRRGRCGELGCLDMDESCGTVRYQRRWYVCAEWVLPSSREQTVRVSIVSEMRGRLVAPVGSRWLVAAGRRLVVIAQRARVTE